MNAETTAVVLSDDELRAIAKEARAWWRNATEDSFTKIDEPSTGIADRAYAEGVIAERKRARAVRVLAMKLAKSLQQSRGVWAAFDNVLDEARAAGLLASNES